MRRHALLLAAITVAAATAPNAAAYLVEYQPAPEPEHLGVLPRNQTIQRGVLIALSCTAGKVLPNGFTIALTGQAGPGIKTTPDPPRFSLAGPHVCQQAQTWNFWSNATIGWTQPVIATEDHTATLRATIQAQGAQGGPNEARWEWLLRQAYQPDINATFPSNYQVRVPPASFGEIPITITNKGNAVVQVEMDVRNLGPAQLADIDFAPRKNVNAGSAEAPVSVDAPVRVQALPGGPGINQTAALEIELTFTPRQVDGAAYYTRGRLVVVYVLIQDEPPLDDEPGADSPGFSVLAGLAAFGLAAWRRRYR